MSAKVCRKNGKDFAQCDKHSCKKCARCGHHTVKGPAVKSASEVRVNGAPILRVGDTGVHDKATCCGANKWEIITGKTAAHEVFAEGQAIACVGDFTLHDQKDQGQLMQGSPDVFAKSA